MTKAITIIFIFSCIVFGNGTMLTALSKMLLALVAIPFLTNKNIWKIGKDYFIWCFLFVAYCWLSSYWAFDRHTALFYLPTISFVFICNVALWASIKGCHKPVDYWLKIILVATIGMGLYFIANEGIRFEEKDEARTQDTEINLNTIGMLAAIGGSLSTFFYIKRPQGTTGRVWIYADIFLVFLVLMSASRKAMFIPVIVFFIYKLFTGNFYKIFKNTIFALLLGTVWLWMILNIPALYNIAGFRLEALINGLFDTGGEVDSSTQTRMLLVEFGVEMFKQKMWTGYGIANFRDLKVSFLGGMELYAHNNYIELLVDIGLIGTLLYYSIYLILGYQLYKIIRRTGDKLSIILFAIIVSMMVSQYGFVAYYSLFTNIFLTIIAYHVMITKKTIPTK